MSEPGQHEPRVQATSKRNWGIAEVFLGILITLVISQVVFGIYQLIADPQPGADRTPAGVFAALLPAWLGFGLGAIGLTALHGSWRAALGYKFDLPTDLWKGALTGIMGQLLVTAVYLPFTIFSPDSVKGLGDPAQQLTDVFHGPNIILFVIATCLITPQAEELFFRGLTMRAFARRFGPVAGIVISGIIFGLLHFQALQTLGLVALGWLFAWRATRTGRIGETIVAHGVFNLLTVLVSFWG